MLEIRPNCEWCDTDLLPNSTQAMICTYECTFCVTCVNGVLGNVCPNCGGGFTLRPIRPLVERRNGLSIKHQPASIKRVHSQYSEEEVTAFCTLAKHIKPEKR